MNIYSDGNAVWVLQGDDNYLAKFSLTGVEVHMRASDQERNPLECIWREDTKPDLETWTLFKNMMTRFYGLWIDEEMRPKWL